MRTQVFRSLQSSAAVSVRYTCTKCSMLSYGCALDSPPSPQPWNLPQCRVTHSGSKVQVASVGLTDAGGVMARDLLTE